MTPTTTFLGVKVNKGALVIGTLITLFLCTFHFLLASSYHYLTSAGDCTTFFDFDHWSYPFKRDLYGFNFFMLFIGFLITLVITFAAVDKKDKDN